MNTTETRTRISSLPADPSKHVRIIVVDCTEDMERYAETAYMMVFDALLSRAPRDAVGFIPYQGEYLEDHHEDHSHTGIADGLPNPAKCGGANRALVYALEALLRRNDKSKYPIQARISYIGAGLNTDKDLLVIDRRDAAIKRAMLLGWTFDVTSFVQSPRQCQQSIGFPEPLMTHGTPELMAQLGA